MKFIGKGKGPSYVVSNLRFHYHATAIEANNVLNQLKLRSDKKAELVAKNHTMIIFNDIFPRLGIDYVTLDELTSILSVEP